MQIIISLSRSYLIDCGEDGAATRQLPRAIVVGARARYEVIDTSDMEELVGAAFHPGGFASLFWERADLFFERSPPLDTPGLGAPLVDRLSAAATPQEKLRTIEEQLTALLRHDPERSVIVDHAIHRFRNPGLSVAQCARSVGICERRLSQLFREEVGLSPKCGAASAGSRPRCVRRTPAWMCLGQSWLYACHDDSREELQIDDYPRTALPTGQAHDRMAVSSFRF